MKSFVASVSTSVLGILLSIQAMGATSFPLKICHTDIKKLDGSGEVIPTRLMVYSDQGNVHGEITQTINGETSTFEDEAQESFYLINHRVDQITPADRGSLNEGEELLAHAYALETDPELKAHYITGIDLKAVHSIRVFQIGASSVFGMTAIVEANDKTGNVLGSFMSGLVVSPCK